MKNRRNASWTYVDVNAGVQFGSGDQPSDDTTDETRDGSDNATPLGSLLPGNAESDWDDGRSEEDSHEGIEPTHGDANVEEDGASNSHEDGKGGNHVVGDAKDLTLSGVRVNVPLVDIIGQDTGDGDEFGTCGAGDGQEEEDEHCGGSGLTKKGSGSSGGWQTCRDLRRSQDSHVWVATKSDGGETHGGGESEGDTEPSESSEQVSLDARSGL